MKFFATSVAIACDRERGNFQQAIAMRSVLESFGIQVYFYQLLQQQNTLDFLAGNYADCDYTILYCFGRDNKAGESQVNLQVVEQQDHDYDNKLNWHLATVSLTANNLGEYIKNAKGTFICGAATGDQWAAALLKVGYRACILPTTVDIACNSQTLFLTGFFYYLMMHSLDY